VNDEAHVVCNARHVGHTQSEGGSSVHERLQFFLERKGLLERPF
jgi:hypothetical protein